MPVLPGDLLQVISQHKSSSPSLLNQLQTTVSCYTSTDHHHLMHNISLHSNSPVSRMARARHRFLLFFSNCQPLTHFALVPQKSDIISHTIIIVIIITSACGALKTDISDSIAVSPILPSSPFSPRRRQEKFLSFALDWLNGVVRSWSVDRGGQLMYRMSVCFNDD